MRYVFDASLELAEHIAESVRPPVPATDPMPSLVTHYGEAFNGNVLGCGTGYYSSDNPTIVAVSPALYAQIPCGTLLQICGDGGCIVAQRQDACPGCSPVLFDLSEAAFAAVCGVPSGVCAANVSILQTCSSIDLAWEDRPEPPEEPERIPSALDDLAEAPFLAEAPEPEDEPIPGPPPGDTGEDSDPTDDWECHVR